MRHTHGPLLQRAALILGGEDQLRDYLGASPTRFSAWMTGTVPLPWNDFLKVVDLLSERYDQQIHQSHNETRRRLTLRSRQPVDRVKALRARSLRAVDSRLRTYGRACEVQRMSVKLAAAPPPAPLLAEHLSLCQSLFSPTFAPRDRRELADAALDATMAVAGTDLGDLQFVEAAGQHVEAQRGFPAALAQSLESVEREFPCDRQLQFHDLREALPFNSPAGRAIIDAGSRSLVVTPVLDHTGLVLGSINAHFREPHEPAPATLSLLTMISRRTAIWLDARPG